MTAAQLVREARRTAGLTQSELGSRTGLSQPAIARIERPGSNPTVATLDRLLRACDRTLGLAPAPHVPEVDEGQIRARLRLTPAERLDLFQRSHRNLVDLLAVARRVG